jgi:hypothetical protein
MSARETLTRERLVELLTYDPATGEFRNRVNRGNRARAGEIAGYLDVNGYRVIGIDGLQYLAHRLAWLYVHGSFPNALLDHRDGDPSNNRDLNLRQATHSQNRANSHLRADNTSGRKGVYWHRGSRKWIARITAAGRCLYLGCFTDLDAAHWAYIQASFIHHGRFARVS